MGTAIPSLLSRPPPTMALPLTVLPSPHINGKNIYLILFVIIIIIVLVVIGSSPTARTVTPTPQPLHTVAVPFNLSPGALITPAQVQQLITQFHSPLTSTSHDMGRISGARQSHDAGTPLKVQSVSIASENRRKERQMADNGGIVLNPSQFQALVSQMQTHQKLSNGPFQIVTALPAGFNTVTTE